MATDPESIRRAEWCADLAAAVHRHQEDLGRRLDETRGIFDRRVLAVDCHTHSVHSDGIGTPAENREAVRRARLDFFFATDHDSLDQRAEVADWPEASWGQEPATLRHHYGMLLGDRLFEPRHDSVAADFFRAREIAPFVWIPHPAGWYPNVRYNDETIDALWTLGDAFAMEVLNGAARILRAYDAFDETAVKVWDRLLSDGRRVTVLGGSDAHLPEGIGCAFTGVYAPRRTDRSIVKTLNTGRCFASESSLMDFAVNGRPMGSEVRAQRGEPLAITCRVADAAGLAEVRLVSGGKVVRTIRGKGRPLVEGEFSRRAAGRPTYLRLESTAVDDRRAFSTPVYVRPRG